MAMVVQHNIAAQMALGELNKNVNKVGQLLGKVSSGQKINSAKDDAASFCISEKMREQIRTLLQDDQNVQNGSSLFKIAEGGINSIVEELRNLKELAINAANDTNTDADRATIQKEFDQRRANIDDIATTTNYNGKILMDGTYNRPDTETLDDILSYIFQNYEYDYDGNGKVVGTKHVTGVGGTIDDKHIYSDGVTGMFKLDKVVAEGKDVASVNWVNGRTVYGSNVSRGAKGYPAYSWLNLDFSGMSRKNGGTLHVPADIHKQGFSIFCSDYSDCPSFHGFMFDATKPIGTGEKVYNTSGPVYIVGVGGMYDYFNSYNSLTDTQKQNYFSEELASALYLGVKDAISKDSNHPEYVSVDGNTEIIHLAGYGDEVELRCEIDGKYVNDDGGYYTNLYSIMQHYNMWIYEGYDTGAVYAKPLPPATGGETISITDPIYIDSARRSAEDYNPLIIHHGPKANQSTHFFINDMHTKSLKAGKFTQEDLDSIVRLDGDREKQEALINVYLEAKFKSLDQASVQTRRDANVAIRIVDGAIDYALNEATYIGAYLQRLDYTDSNVVTMGENVQGAESSIRDADMAKEMTEYTKMNVLSQASQAMLAQANQNSSQVLSLLQ